MVSTPLSTNASQFFKHHIGTGINLLFGILLWGDSGLDPALKTRGKNVPHYYTLQTKSVQAVQVLNVCSWPCME